MVVVVVVAAVLAPAPSVPLLAPSPLLPARRHLLLYRLRFYQLVPTSLSSLHGVTEADLDLELDPELEAAHGWPHAAVSHPRYYFQDGNVTLEIDRTRYKIHRHFLVTNSPVFAKELPPYIIYTTLTGNVDKQAFELVLSLFYPKDCFSGHDIKSEPDWRKVLVFACQYKMTVIRDMALTKVPTLDPVEKVELATKYGLKDWLVSAYVDLCMKDLGDRNGWSAEEGKKIGLEGVLALADVRRDILEHLEEHLDRDKVLKTVEKKVEALKQI
ncbi:uncharacterized protein BT62DRAFT_917462 [Guyanagaster necrorhizus]|uniref:BTB domain-containing protein n=1 Tax=Guyanagaster necrorhizus TaxID=856835 RepID=A0A9P8AW79_9AGAR|nr:uncharacterized protein BT62DRAFT_917462 [Guyanagaster necrorhizus MCA 3950]KAG7449886.1 hypothetical protein BT62DRAFT_917462 [Guyanagaster necrorhizus MCA 3950]